MRAGASSARVGGGSGGGGLLGGGALPAQVCWQGTVVFDIGDECRKTGEACGVSLLFVVSSHGSSSPLSKPQLGVNGFDHAVVAIFESSLSETGIRQWSGKPPRQGQGDRQLDVLMYEFWFQRPQYQSSSSRLTVTTYFPGFCFDTPKTAFTSHLSLLSKKITLRRSRTL